MKSGLAVALAVFLAACAHDDLEVAAAEQELLSLNSLAPEDFWGNHGRVQDMLRSTLKNTATTSIMVSDTNRRKVVEYLVRCGLRQGQTVVLTDAFRNPHKLEGLLGLVPGWTSSPPTETQRRWMDACMGLHLNAFRVQVPVSMRAPIKPFDQLTEAEKPFTCDEAAFYRGPDGLHACHGDCAQEFCSAPDARLELRVCGASQSCGLTIDGACSKVCARFVDGRWEECNGSVEVFTSFVEGGKQLQCELVE